MTINNDFLELIDRPRCKTAILIMTILLFATLAVSELTNRPSPIIQRLSEYVFVFWIARATKTNRDAKSN